jgi:hypothetical protein
MRFLPGFDFPQIKPANIASPSGASIEIPESTMPEESGLLKTIGWVSAALGAVALGLIVGREIRQRYKFNRRTPYDLYAHSGDELPDVEFGVGI